MKFLKSLVAQFLFLRNLAKCLYELRCYRGASWTSTATAQNIVDILTRHGLTAGASPVTALVMVRHAVNLAARCKSATWHEPPNRDVVAANAFREAAGERLRAEIEAFLDREQIVGIMMETDRHFVDVQCARLPDHIKPVLTKYGSIYVEDRQP